MQVKKAELIAAMRKCLPGVDRGSSIIEGTDTFIFTEDAIHSYNDAISVSVPFPLPTLKGAVKSMDFFRLISKMKTEVLEIVAVEGAWEIVSGPTKASITLVNSTILGHLQNLKIGDLAWRKLPENFLSAIRLCLMAGNTHPIRGIFVNGNTMVSTDAIRINRHMFKEEVGSFYVDDPAASELLKIGGFKEVATSDGWVSFRGDDGIVFSSKRKDAGQYPYDRIIAQLESFAGESGKEDTHNRFPKDLAESVDRVAVLSSEVAGAQAIRLTLRKEDLIIFSERISGRVEEAVKWETPFKKSPDLEIWVDSGFLREACRKIVQFSIRKNEHATVIVFQSDDYVQIASTMVSK